MSPGRSGGAAEGCPTRSSSARARTASRRRSRSRGPAARCSCCEGAATIGGGAPHRRADAAGLPARRLLGDPPARGRLAVPARAAAAPSTGSSWIQPDVPLAHPLDGGRAAVLQRSLEETAAGLGGPTAPPTPSSWARSCDGWDDARRAIVLGAAPAAPPPAARRALRRVGDALGGRAGSARASAARGPGRCSRGNARALDAAARAPGRRPRFALVCSRSATPSGWPVAAAARRRSPTRWRRYLRSLGGEIETGQRGALAGRACRGAGAVLLDVTPRQLSRSRATRLPRRYRRGLGATATGRACSSSTRRSTAPIPGRPPACPPGRDGARRRHAGRDRRLRGDGRGRRPSRAAFVLRRAAEPVRPRAARRRARTRSGRTATSPTARRWT